MKLFVMCARDVKADAFGNPYFAPSIAMAERSFGDEVNRAAEDNILYKHPEDFELYCLGTFDTSSGEFDVGKRVQVCAAGSLVRALPGDKRQLPLSGV